MATPTGTPEAAWLFFSTVQVNGHEYNVTFREGATKETVDHVLDLVAYVGAVAEGKGVKLPPTREYQDEQRRAQRKVRKNNGNNQAASGPPPSPNDQEEQAPDWDKPRGEEPILKLTVSGTEDKPMVNFWSSNVKLKYPYLKAPSSMVTTELNRAYPAAFDDEDLSSLSICGKELGVNWQVGWVKSAKNPKWKDLHHISIPKLGQAVEKEDDFAAAPEEPITEDQIPF